MEDLGIIVHNLKRGDSSTHDIAAIVPRFKSSTTACTPNSTLHVTHVPAARHSFINSSSTHTPPPVVPKSTECYRDVINLILCSAACCTPRSLNERRNSPPGLPRPRKTPSSFKVRPRNTTKMQQLCCFSFGKGQ